MRRISSLALLGCAAAVGVTCAFALSVLDACVPADTRPTPGSVTFTVSPSPAVVNGVTTIDGWNVTFERVLVAMGRTTLGSGCVDYAEASYDRVLDVTKNGGQKLSIVHGLGECDVRFRVGSPSTDAVLGDGVTEQEKAALRIPVTDGYIRAGGVSLAVQGAATRAGVTKRFRLLFRPRVRYARCAVPEDGGVAAGIELVGEVDKVFDIRIEAEALLRDDVDASTASLRFEPFASADKDGDGNVTLEELKQVPIATIRDAGAFETGTYEFDDDGGVFRPGRSVPINTLGDYVYILLFPQLPRFRQTGSCGVGFRLSGFGPPG
jgi:hypothetical protein